jgi:hypothetical protein
MAFGVVLDQLYVQTGEAKRQETKRLGASARSGSHLPDTGWRARIDAALALLPSEGKRVWQQPVAEAIAAKSADHVRLLIQSAQTRDAGAAIARLAVDNGIVTPNS